MNKWKILKETLGFGGIIWGLTPQETESKVLFFFFLKEEGEGVLTLNYFQISLEKIM